MPTMQVQTGQPNASPRVTEALRNGGGEAVDGIDERKKRLRFTHTWDIIMLKSVSQAEAHTAPHGESQERFKEACFMFVEAAPPGSLQNYLPITWKTISDRFKKVIVDHRTARKNNAVASGIVEVRGEREELLDDMALEVDEYEERRRNERNERTNLDERLRSAGEEMRRNAAMRRKRGEGEVVEIEEGGDTVTRKKKARKSVQPASSDDDEVDLIVEQMKERSGMELKRVEMEQRRLEFERKREERLQSSLQKDEDRQERRLALDEKRVRIEEQRAEVDREERKSLIAVLGALVNKLK